MTFIRHRSQYIDVVHREHAVVETDGLRTAKALALRGLPSKASQVNCGLVIAANIAADLPAWSRLPGFYDIEDMRTRNQAGAQSVADPQNPGTIEAKRINCSEMDLIRTELLKTNPL